jgi:hypothetical protein
METVVYTELSKAEQYKMFASNELSAGFYPIDAMETELLFDPVFLENPSYRVSEEGVITNDKNGFKVDFQFKKLIPGNDMNSTSRDILETLNAYCASFSDPVPDQYPNNSQMIDPDLLKAIDLCLYYCGYPGKKVLVRGVTISTDRRKVYAYAYGNYATALLLPE